MIEELHTKLRLRLGRLRYDKQTAGVLVNTVYQSHTGIIRVIGRQVTQMPGDGIDQRSVEVTHAGMDNEAGGFVDNHQLVVLIDHIQRDVLGFDGGVIVRTVEHQRDNIAGTHLIVALDGTLVDVDKAGIGSLLDTVTGGVAQMLHHIFVHTQRHLSGIYLQADMFVELLLFTVLVKQFQLLFCQLFLIHILPVPPSLLLALLAPPDTLQVSLLDNPIP